LKDDLPQSGVYVLIMKSRTWEGFNAGAWGPADLKGGYYAYVGRAKKGLSTRLARHARREGKRLRWHVDYLLEAADLKEAWIFPLNYGECALASRLEKGGTSREGLRGFGASDCHCPGHLFYMGRRRPSRPTNVSSIIIF
jgi:sugar fermentation stimulation protein A